MPDLSPTAAIDCVTTLAVFLHRNQALPYIVYLTRFEQRNSAYQKMCHSKPNEEAQRLLGEIEYSTNTNVDYLRGIIGLNNWQPLFGVMRRQIAKRACM